MQPDARYFTVKSTDFFTVYLTQGAFQCLWHIVGCVCTDICLLFVQEGDTALNLIIKSTKLRETGDMYKCAELLVQQGALSTYKDLVRPDIYQSE